MAGSSSRWVGCASSRPLTRQKSMDVAAKRHTQGACLKHLGWHLGEILVQEQPLLCIVLAPCLGDHSTLSGWKSKPSSTIHSWAKALQNHSS